jgi:hypothetical protein
MTTATGSKGHLADVRALVEASAADGYIAVSLPIAQAAWLVNAVALAQRQITVMRHHITRDGRGCGCCARTAAIALAHLAE